MKPKSLISDHRFLTICPSPDKTKTQGMVPLTTCFKCKHYFTKQTYARYCGIKATIEVNP